MRKTSVILSWILLFSFGIYGCQKENTITKIVLSEPEIIIGVGQTSKIEAVATPGNKNIVFNWSSDNSKIATVDSKGTVTGVSDGTTNIVISYKGIVQAVKVKVLLPATGIKLAPDLEDLDLQILFGAEQSKQYTVSLEPINSNDDIYWLTSDSNVAIVYNTGLIVAKGVGKATITVQNSTGQVKKQIRVNVTAIGSQPKEFNPLYFKRAILPNDNYRDRPSSSIEGIWDNVRLGVGASSCDLPGPQSFTFDLGKTGHIAYVHQFLYADANYPAFTGSSPQKFEVWGCETLDPSGSWDSWTKLMDCDVTKPSGLPYGTTNYDDMIALRMGERFYNMEHNDVKVRYLRVKIDKTWGGTACWLIGEFKVYGDY